MSLLWIAGAPALTAVLALLNLLFWPRGRPNGTLLGRVSALVPARDEEENIAACVSALHAAGADEIIIYDDASRDRTNEIATALAGEIPNLSVLQGSGLPEGWVGKPHACHRLAEAASGELLLFVDADTRLEPDGLRRIRDLMATYDADVLTAYPKQEMVSFTERLVLPILDLTYVSWLFLPLIWRSRNPRFLAANGQVLATRRVAYDIAGGFEAVREEVVDDMAFTRNAKLAGLTVLFADGFSIARCRMYHSGGEVFDGFSKNLFEGIGARAGTLLVVLALYAAAFLAPWVAVLFDGPARVAGVVGIAANLVARSALAVRRDHPPEAVLLHPLSIVLFFVIALRSFAWSLRGGVTWRGRTYWRKRCPESS